MIRAGLVAILGAGAGLLLAGCGLSREPAQPPTLSPATAKVIRDALARPGAKVTLLNIWATWCDPCREEFPDLMKVYQKYRTQGLRLVLVSADFKKQQSHAIDFLTEQGVDFPSFIKDENDQDFINGLEPEWSGVLPACVLYDSAGKKITMWEGQRDFAFMERQLLNVLAPADAPVTEEK